MTQLKSETALETLTDDEITNIVIGHIVNEMTLQDAKWGEQRHQMMKWVAILAEEVGETAQAILEYDTHYPYKWTEAHKQKFFEIQMEVIQIAAVAIQFARDLHRKREVKEMIWSESFEEDEDK